MHCMSRLKSERIRVHAGSGMCNTVYGDQMKFESNSTKLQADVTETPGIDVGQLNPRNISRTSRSVRIDYIPCFRVNIHAYCITTNNRQQP